MKLNASNSRSLALTSLLLMQFALGCGGGGGHTAYVPKGRLQIGITWPPTQTRVIPTAALSLLIQVKDASNNVVSSALVARPASTATLTDVPVGSLTVVVNAYASTDGTGVSLATASTATTVTDGNTSNVDLTMASTIDHLIATPNPLTIGAGTTTTFVVTAVDINGSTVLVSPSSFSFASSNAGVATVTSVGLVTASTTDGSATITVTEGDSGKTLSIPVSVVPTVTVSPSTPIITVRATQQFTATVVGPTNTSVTWSVQEGASGGTVSASGLYTAPSTHGTFHVVATSAADTTRKATATVVVGAGSINVGVH